MKSLIAVSTLIAATIATPAFASSTASAILSDFTLTLTSINPNVSFTPSLDLYSSVTSNLSGSAFSQTVNDYQHFDAIGNHSATTSGSAADLYAQSSSSISGDLLSNTVNQSNGSSQGNEGNYTSNSVDYGYFTLSPNTQATFTAKADTQATTTVVGGNLNEFAQAYVYLDVVDPTGQIHQDSLITATNPYRPSAQSLSDLAWLSIVFSNTSSDAISGYEFHIQTNVNGYSNAPITDSPSAVPLPAAAPLFLSGLGLLGFSAKKRKSTKV